jgi:hypothetical protein
MMKGPACVSLDGSWDHRRNGFLCVVTMIDTSTDKIADCYICERQNRSVRDYTDDAPGNMEMEGVEKIPGRWKNDCRVKYFERGSDGKTRTKIKEVGWHIEEILDVNHAAKAVTKRMNDSQAKNGNIFKGIKNKLTEWLTFLLRGLL